MILNRQSQYWDQNLMKGSGKVESNFANITFILLIMQDMCILMNLIFIQKIYIVKDRVFLGEEFHEEQRKSGNQRISVYGTISRKAKFPLVFISGNIDSKKLNEFQRSCQILEIFLKTSLSYIWTTIPSMYRLRL